MADLPISSNKLQTSGNAASALPANFAADGLATDVWPAEPFAFLLARQIGEVNLPITDVAQTAIAMDGNVTDGGTDPVMREGQDLAAAAADIPGDPANMLAAILMQLPAPEDKGPNAEGMSAAQSLALAPLRKTKDPQAMTHLLAVDNLSTQVTKHTEQQSNLIKPAPNTAQAIASPAISAATPVALTNDILPAISTPLGNNGWAEEFSQKISWMSTQQNQVAELHLNPPNLGPLDVVLKISDNQATALFASPHGAVRDAVENALPKLRELLADNGIMLGNATISDQSPRDRSMNEFMNQDSGTAARHETSGSVNEPIVSLPAATQTVTARRHNGMVDTFA